MEKLVKLLTGASSLIKGARQIFPKSPQKALQDSKKDVNLTDKGKPDYVHVAGNTAAWVGFAVVFGRGLLEIVKVKWPSIYESVVQILGLLGG